MTKDKKLLSDSELLLEEAAIKQQLSELDSKQQNMVWSLFIAKRQQLNAQLEIVLFELGCRNLS